MASFLRNLNPMMGLNMMDKFLHPEDAYHAGEKEVQKGWNQAQDYQKPFWQQGLDQYGDLNSARQQLMNPEELQSKWANNYETSPYAQRMLAMNNQQGQEAASSMGLGGSSAGISNIQQGAGDIMQKDRQQYMDDLMKKYMQGIGLGKDLYNTGASTGENLGRQSMQQGENMASLEYGANAAPGKLFENLLRTGGKLYMGGGANSFNQ